MAHEYQYGQHDVSKRERIDGAGRTGHGLGLGSSSPWFRFDMAHGYQYGQQGVSGRIHVELGPSTITAATTGTATNAATTGAQPLIL
jgi:hypothetical protein